MWVFSNAFGGWNAGYVYVCLQVEYLIKKTIRIYIHIYMYIIQLTHDMKLALIPRHSKEHDSQTCFAPEVE
jgi:hypothetical protein